MRKISPNIKELSFNQTFQLANNFSIEVIPFQYLDSMLIVKINNLTIPNLNDCDIKNDFQLDFIKKKTGLIDILMVQFSYALGKSNKDNKKERENWSYEILKELSKNIKFLKPKFVIPFSIFCYFSKYDNFYMNDSINKIDKTIDFLSKENPNTKFLSFYPGDTWDLKSYFSNQDSFDKYKKDYGKIDILPFDEQIINFDNLKKSSKKFIETIKKNNNFFNLYKFFNKKKYNIYFKLTDINKTYFFDFDKGLIEIDDFNKDNPWCSLSAQTLNNLFSSGYGYDALIIGGRFEANKLGLRSLNSIFRFQAKNYQNIYYNFSTILNNLLKNFFKTSRIYHKR